VISQKGQSASENFRRFAVRISSNFGGEAMTDASFVTEDRASSVQETANDTLTGRVSLSRLSAQGFTSSRDPAQGGSSCYFEEYEIGIGAWKATIVKMLDYGAGRTRYRAKYNADQQFGCRERPRRHSVRRRRSRRYIANS
jgi:hypothetical protein